MIVLKVISEDRLKFKKDIGRNFGRGSCEIVFLKKFFIFILEGGNLYFEIDYEE